MHKEKHRRGRPSSAWGIDIGSSAVRAVRVESDGSNPRVSDFAVIPHRRLLTTPDVDRSEVVCESLGRLRSEVAFGRDTLAVSYPGFMSFARFAKLPSVEPSKVPDIIQFEAVQQIPYPIEDVEWGFHVFPQENTPEFEVAILAIVEYRLDAHLALLGEVGLQPDMLALSNVAVYNAFAAERERREHVGAVAYVDIGASATDVVIADGKRLWIRTFPLGGTHFTEALATEFKLSYGKAERLKLEGEKGEYADQFKPVIESVLGDLIQDLQRSVGYYQSLHRDTQLNLLVGCGSTFKLPGLRSAVSEALQLEVDTADNYLNLDFASGCSDRQFAEHALDMAAAYGLALQGVGMGTISVNFAPRKSGSLLGGLIRALTRA